MNKKVTLDTGTELPLNLNLTLEFKNFFKLMENTDLNMFITGKAGSGKSTLLEYFRQNTYKNHAILAPTGIAAIKARGQTIHSFFKFPPRVIQESDVKILRDQKLIKNLQEINHNSIQNRSKSSRNQQENGPPFTPHSAPLRLPWCGTD